MENRWQTEPAHCEGADLQKRTPRDAIAIAVFAVGYLQHSRLPDIVIGRNPIIHARNRLANKINLIIGDTISTPAAQHKIAFFLNQRARTMSVSHDLLDLIRVKPGKKFRLKDHDP